MTKMTLRELLKELVVGLVSLAVVLYAAGYLLGQEDQSAFAFEVVTTNAASAGSIVVYGRTQDAATSKPLRGVALTLARGNAGGSYTRVGTAASAADGTFSIEAQGTQAGDYRLLAEAEISQRTVRSAFTLNAVPGQSYGVDVRLVNKEYFVLLPLPGY